MAAMTFTRLRCRFRNRDLLQEKPANRKFRVEMSELPTIRSERPRRNVSLDGQNSSRQYETCSEVLPVKLAIGLFGLALYGSLTTAAQILSTSSCGCGVSSSGVSCSCLSAMPINKTDSSTSKQTVCDGHRKLLIVRIVLSPGALLTRWVPGEDQLIIGMGAGELVNEAKSPPVSLAMSDGQIVLMPEEEPYALRNPGKQDVNLHSLAADGGRL